MRKIWKHDSIQFHFHLVINLHVPLEIRKQNSSNFITSADKVLQADEERMRESRRLKKMIEKFAFFGITVEGS